MPKPRKVAIAGAGIIGLACGFELLERGHQVTVFDPATPESSTSWAAAGMIAPAYELMLQGEAPDEALSELAFESAALWQDFAARLRRISGLPTGYNRQPTLAVARSSAELARLQGLEDRLAAMSRPFRRVSPTALATDYGVSNALQGGLLLLEDHQVDNRRALTVLASTLARQGAQFVRAPIHDADDLKSHGEFDLVVWARGTSESGVSQVVKGQALSLAPVEGGPQQTVRFGAGYAVPKPDRIVIGATSEWDFKSASVNEAVTDALLEEATNVLPALRRATVLERWSGLRPKGQGERPLIGAVSGNEYVATAHYRNGVLLAPVTARLIAGMIEGTSLPTAYEVFLPGNGAPATA